MTRFLESVAAPWRFLGSCFPAFLKLAWEAATSNGRRPGAELPRSSVVFIVLLYAIRRRAIGGYGRGGVKSSRDANKKTVSSTNTHEYRDGKDG
jgi:hypothetical protein